MSLRKTEDQKSPHLLEIPHYKLLLIIAFATFLSWSALNLVVQKLDPYTSTDLALSLFFISAFLALTGSFTIILFFIKKWWADDEVYVKHVTISLRQGMLLSTCTILCAALLMLGLLRIWNGLLLVILVTGFEFYLSGKDELK